MSEPIVLKYTLPPDMISRAMVQWRREGASRYRVIWQIAIALGIVVGYVLAVSLVPLAYRDLVVGCGLGAGLGMLGTNFAVRRQTAKLQSMARARIEKEGEIQATISPQGVTFASSHAQGRFDWAVVDGFFTMRDAAVLRVGATLHPFPDTALPTNMKRAELLDQMRVWKAAA